MKQLTVFTKRGPDLDGREVLEELLELGGGELRPPLAAGLLVQPAQQRNMRIYDNDISSVSTSEPPPSAQTAGLCFKKK